MPSLFPLLPSFLLLLLAWVFISSSCFHCPLWPPNFSQGVTPFLLNRTLPLHHWTCLHSARSDHFPVQTPSVVSYYYQQFFSRWCYSFESFGGTRNSSLGWRVHRHCKTLNVPGCRLLHARRNPLVVVTTKKCTRLLRQALVLPQLTITCKRKVCPSCGLESPQRPDPSKT